MHKIHTFQFHLAVIICFVDFCNVFCNTYHSDGGNLHHIAANFGATLLKFQSKNQAELVCCCLPLCSNH